MSLDLNTINPYIRVAFESVLSVGTRLKRRIIFDYEIIYVERGSFVLNYDGRNYECREGQFVFLRPGVPHSIEPLKEELSQPHIHFDLVYNEKSVHTPVSFKDMHELTQEQRELVQADAFKQYPYEPFVVFSDKERALSLFYSIVKEPLESRLVLKGRLCELISMMISDNFSSCLNDPSGAYDTVGEVKDYIDAGQGMALKLSDLEKQFNYSKYYLERQFKSRYGVSLISYRNSKRMEQAFSMLQTEGVSAVSEKLGFTSIYVFSRAFKKHFGISPSRAKTPDGSNK